LNSILLQLFCSYNFWYMECCSSLWMFRTFTLVHSELCLRCPVWLFPLSPWIRSFPASCAGIFWMVYIWYELPFFIIMGTTFVFTVNMRLNSVVNPLYFRLFSASSL
jgi:hypothetical protein